MIENEFYIERVRELREIYSTRTQRSRNENITQVCVCVCVDDLNLTYVGVRAEVRAGLIERS